MLAHNSEKKIGVDLVKITKIYSVAEGIYLKDIPKDRLIKICTYNNTYHMVIVNKRKSLVIVDSQSEVVVNGFYRFRGSTFGGAALKKGWLGVSMSFELSIPKTERFFHSSSVQSIILKQDEELTDAIRKKSSKN